MGWGCSSFWKWLWSHPQLLPLIPDWLPSAVESTSAMSLLNYVPIFIPSLQSLISLFLKNNKNIYLFYLADWVLVAACKIFDLHCSMWDLSCSMWDLVPWPGIEPRPPALGTRSQPLDHQGSVCNPLSLTWTYAVRAFTASNWPLCLHLPLSPQSISQELLELFS